MKKRALLYLVLWLLTCEALGQPYGMGHPGGHFERPETGPTATPKEKILGRCTVLAGNGALAQSPCGSLILTLTPTEGGAPLSSRVSENGTFSFNVEKNKKFVIGVQSKFFEVISPKEELTQGDKIELQLKQK